MSELPVPIPDQTLSESLLSPSAPLPPVTLSTPPSSDVPQTSYKAKQATANLPVSERLGRFEVHSEIGRGGMGAVLRGRDPALGRDLAIKVLLAGRQGNADALRRFHEEAQIGGQLQHPGLVPVYEMGADGEGRPFFAMKLVDGQTLAALLKERTSPADNLPRFLTIFEQVCQALAYAHARGVIHRDLKPANVMVGAFGEVQVMDWGLAKVLGSKGSVAVVAGSVDPGGNAVHTARTESSGSESRDGSVMGTPAYMPPEQARGEIDRLDQRADVFGLGAILCEILTGQPAFTGQNVSAILGRSASGDLTETFVRLDACGVDQELVRLAKACLAAEPAHRPTDGSVIAAQVAAHRASVEERLRNSELERAAAEVRAVEEKRRRRVQLALAGAVLLILTLGSAGGWWIRHQQVEQRQELARHNAELREQTLERQAEHARQETERVRREAELRLLVEDDLNRLTRARENRQWDNAEKILERAEGRLGQGGGNELRQRVEKARDDLAQVRRNQSMSARLEEARIRAAAAGNEGDDGGSCKRYEEAFAWYGLDIRQRSPETIAADVVSSPLREELVVALDQWAVLSALSDRADTQRLSVIADRADSSNWRRQLRTAVLSNDHALVGRLAASANVAEISPASIAYLAVAVRQAQSSGRALTILREGRQHFPADFWLNFELGYALYSAAPSQVAEAACYFTAAQSLRPDSPLANYNLGVVLLSLGKPAEAAAAFGEAVRLKPDYTQAHYNLGIILRNRGQSAEAADHYRAVIREQPAHYLGHNNLGLALWDLGKKVEAEAAFRQAIRLKPDNPKAHLGLALVLRSNGQFQPSLAEFQLAHRLGSATPDWRYPSAQWVREAEHLVDLDHRLPDILSSKAQPANAAEFIEFAEVCGFKRQYLVAARFFTDAFEAEVSLANDLTKEYRYAAARYAALAADGKDEGETLPDEPERARLRTQTLSWLRDDLAAWGKRLDGGKPADLALVAGKMSHWQQDADLAGVRDTESLAKLPETERADWQKLWQDVEALLKRAAAPK